MTDFADQAVVLPVVAACAIGLALGGAWRLGLAWAACVGGVLATTLAGKLLLQTCLLGGATPLSPSGHTAAATVVSGGLAIVASLALRGGVGLGVGFGAATGAGIAATRVLLGLHTLTEVVLGAGIGLLGLLLFAVIVRRGLPGHLSRRAAVIVLAVACATALTLHGLRLRAESVIADLACRAAGTTDDGGGAATLRRALCARSAAADSFSRVIELQQNQ